MRKKLIADIVVYLMVPIVICNLFSNEYLLYVIFSLIVIAGIYSIIVIRDNKKVNKTALIFFTLSISINLFKWGINSNFSKYLYDTCILILLSIAIISINFTGRNAVKVLYKNIFKSSELNSLYVDSKLKKNNLDKQFNKLSNLILINILILSLIKIYSIGVHGPDNFTNTYNLEFLLSIGFLVGEVYISNNIIQRLGIKDTSFNLIKIRKKVKPEEKIVISLEQYREVNK